MCLNISWWPNTVKEGLAVKCVKKLRYVPREHRWITPFQGTGVPRDGVLVPETRCRFYRHGNQISKRIGAVIYGGAIHAFRHSQNYSGGSRKWWAYDSGWETEKEAYAFGVKAYGSNDLACSFLYIPDIDKSEYKKERTAACKRWQKKRPNWKEVKEVFHNVKLPK